MFPPGEAGIIPSLTSFPAIPHSPYSASPIYRPEFTPIPPGHSGKIYLKMGVSSIHIKLSWKEWKLFKGPGGHLVTSA